MTRRSGRIYRCTLGMAAFAMMNGCLAGSDPGDVWQGSREVIDGTEIVRNPPNPRRTALGDDLLLWRGPSSEDVSRFDEWQEPVRLAATADRLILLDRMAHRVYLVRPADGAVEATLGSRGRGPGEFELPFGVAFSRGEVLVGNGGGRSLERFRTDGTHVGTVRFGGTGFGLFASQRGDVYINGLMDGVGGWWRLNDDGVLEGLSWPEPLAFTLDDCARVSGASEVLVRASCTRPLVQLVATDGRAVREITVDRPAVSPDPAQLDAHLGEVQTVMIGSGMPAGMVERQVQAERERLAVLPIIRAARVDEATGLITIWEQLPDDLGDEAATLHVLAPTGEYETVIAFSDPWVDYVVHDGRLYALTRDTVTGLVGLAAYRLEPAEPGSVGSGGASGYSTALP